MSAVRDAWSVTRGVVTLARLYMSAPPLPAAYAAHAANRGHFQPTVEDLVMDEPIRYDNFRLYRSGYSGDPVPWSDNQLWAEWTGAVNRERAQVVTLAPAYGDARTRYRVWLSPAESPEEGWVSRRVTLDIDAESYGELPLAWYVGAPSDWPSGLARFPEVYGPVIPQGPRRIDVPRGVWTLAARRCQ